MSAVKDTTLLALESQIATCLDGLRQCLVRNHIVTLFEFLTRLNRNRCHLRRMNVFKTLADYAALLANC